MAMNMQIQYLPRFNAFLYSGMPDPLQIAAACPQARRLEDGRIVIPNDLDLLQKLVKRDVPIGMPMSDYDWPSSSGMRPWRSQRFMANFMAANRSCFVLSEMRTGKTMAALWAADYIMRREPGTKALIVAQLSTLRRTWGDAIFENFMGRRRFEVLTGDANRRLRLLGSDADFYIINYEGLNIGASGKKARLQLGGLSREIAERDDLRIAIVDEASAYRDPSSIRHRVGRLLISPKKYTWFLTGTPTPNAPTDAYGLRKIMEPGWQETATNFQRRTMIQVTNFKWRPKQEAKQIVADTLVPAIRFTQADCFDVPQAVTFRRDAELSEEQRKHYREMQRELTLTMQGNKDVSAVNEAALRAKLIQISCGAIYDDEHTPHFLDASPRMKVMLEVIAEAPTKVIVFAPLTSVIDAISLCLTGRNISHLVVDGRAKSERDERISDFRRADGPRVLVAHPGPVARGLDLTSASTIVWFAATDRPEDFMQANERINGAGQKHLRTYVQIAATATEREIFKRLESNQSLQGAILKLLEE